MFPTKNYKRAFEFVQVIIQNIASFFYVGYSNKKSELMLMRRATASV